MAGTGQGRKLWPSFSYLRKVPRGSVQYVTPGGDENWQFPAALGRVARDAGLVHVVDLFLVEEHLGIAPVNLLAHEDIEQVRVDVAVEPHAAEDLERLRQRLALLVGPVLGGQ